ncbi:MAG: sigma-70 family RNA polymerase sigma factor [Anaerolineae bacterium]
MSEAALRERAAALEPAALEEIYDSFAVRIYSYIYHRTGDSSLAEDLCGDVFIRMLEAIRSGRPWDTSLQGWLYRIAHNLIIDHYRRQAKRDGPELDERWMAPQSFGQTFEGLFHSNQLRTAMRFLTEEQRQVVILKFAEGLSNAEVAEILGKTEGAIKALQHRALASLRRIVDDQVEDA